MKPPNPAFAAGGRDDQGRDSLAWRGRGRPQLKRRPLGVTPMTEPSSESKSWLPYAALVLTLVAALLYLLGDAFRSGFLASFGIDKDLFPQPLEAVLVYGFQ